MNAQRFGQPSSAVACTKCRGLGWTKRPGTDWADPCPRCGGAGFIRASRLARLLDVSLSDLRRVRTCDGAGKVIGARVLNAIARVFPEELAT